MKSETYIYRAPNGDEFICAELAENDIFLDMDGLYRLLSKGNFTDKLEICGHVYRIFNDEFGNRIFPND